MRFPFGRGARQREIDGLRQRIAELQDDIARLEESLTAESLDVETTDAYRSVQLLRESMRREELATLHQELRGLEARLQTRTTNRRRPASAANEPESAAAKSEAGVVGSDESQVAARASLTTEALAEVASEGKDRGEPGPVRAALTGYGLPSERAIIEPPLSPRSTLPGTAELPREESVESPAAAGEEPELVAGEVEAEAPEPFAPVEEAPEALVAVEATGGSVAKEEPVEEGVAADAEIPGPATVEVEPTAEPVMVGAEARDSLEPMATHAGGGSGISVADAAPAGPDVEGEAASEVEAEAGEVALEVEAEAGEVALEVEAEAGEVAPEAKAETVEVASQVEAEAVEGAAGTVQEAAGAETSPPYSRSGARVALFILVTLAILAIAAVAGLESGLLRPSIAIAPTAAPAILQTTSPPTVTRPTTVPTVSPRPISQSLSSPLGSEANVYLRGAPPA